MTIVRAVPGDEEIIYRKLRAEHEQFNLPTPTPAVIAGCLQRDWIYHDDARGRDGLERVVIWISREDLRVESQRRVQPVFVVQQCWAPSADHAAVLVKLCRLMIAEGYGDQLVTYMKSPKRTMPIIAQAETKAVGTTDRDDDGKVLTTFSTAMALLLANGVPELDERAR